jgi:hypothetical protein
MVRSKKILYAKCRMKTLSEAGSIGYGLGAKLREVKIRTSTVTDIYRLPEALLGVVFVKDHRVKQDRDTLENNFNKATH